MSLDNIAITIVGTPDQLAPITHRLTSDGHTVRLVDLPEMLLECDMTATQRVVDVADGMATLTVPEWMVPLLTPMLEQQSTTTRIRGATADLVAFDEVLDSVDAAAVDPDAARIDVTEPGAPPLADSLDMNWATPDEQLDELMADTVDGGPLDDVEPEDEQSPPLPETPPDGDQAEDEPVPDTASTTIRPAGIDDPDRPLGDRIVSLLEANPDREWTAPQVSEHITDARNNGVISATLSQLITAGRVNRVGRGRYTAPTAALDVDEPDDHDDDTPDTGELSPAVADVLEFMRREGGNWTLDGLIIEFPHHSEISMRSGVLAQLRHRGLVELFQSGDPGTADVYRAVPA